MTDSRLERIIGQLADFDEQDLDIIMKKISKEREERKATKISKLIKDFNKAFEDLLKEDVSVYYYDEKYGDFRLEDINNFSFD